MQCQQLELLFSSSEKLNSVGSSNGPLTGRIAREITVFIRRVASADFEETEARSTSSRGTARPRDCSTAVAGRYGDQRNPRRTQLVNRAHQGWRLEAECPVRAPSRHG